MHSFHVLHHLSHQLQLEPWSCLRVLSAKDTARIDCSVLIVSSNLSGLDICSRMSDVSCIIAAAVCCAFCSAARWRSLVIVLRSPSMLWSVLAAASLLLVSIYLAVHRQSVLACVSVLAGVSVLCASESLAHFRQLCSFAGCLPFCA